MVYRVPPGRVWKVYCSSCRRRLLLDAEDPGESSDDEEEPLTRTRGFGPVKARSARAGAAVALRVLFEGANFTGVAEARRAGAPRALALSIGLASKDMKHAAAQASITAAGRALQAFAALNVDAAGRAAAEIARASLPDVDAATQKCFATRHRTSDRGRRRRAQARAHPRQSCYAGVSPRISMHWDGGSSTH